MLPFFDVAASTNYLKVWHKISTIDRAIKHFARSIVHMKTVIIRVADTSRVSNTGISKVPG